MASLYDHWSYSLVGSLLRHPKYPAWPPGELSADKNVHDGDPGSPASRAQGEAENPPGTPGLTLVARG